MVEVKKKGFDLTKFPAVKILLGVIAGFAIGTLCSFEQGLFVPLLTFLCGVFLASLILKHKTVAFITGVLTIGIIISFRAESYKVAQPEKIIKPFPAFIKGEVKNVIRTDKKFSRIIVDASIFSHVTNRLDNQRLLLTVFSGNTRKFKALPGTKINVDCKIRPTRPGILPGEFSENQYATANNIQWIATTYVSNISITDKTQNHKYLLNDIRSSISDQIDKLFPKETKGIAICLLTGDKTQIPYEVKQEFSLAGTAHVLAVSGLHIGIISVIIYLLLSFIGNNWIRFTVFSILVISFIILTGAHASSIRAGFMAIAIMLAIALQRKYETLNIVALVVLIVIIIYPGMIYSVGFQMSVAAITGIVLFYKHIHKFFKGLLSEKSNILINSIISSISITFAASISVAPIIAYYFNVFSIISPLTNLFCIPLIFLGMIFTIISVFLSYLYFPIAELYSASADLAFSTCMAINSYAVDLPLSYTQGNISFVLSVIITIIMIYFFINNNKDRLAFRLISVTIIFFLSLYVFMPEDNDNIEIFPRENSVATFIPNEDTIFIIIADRKPGLYPSVDYSLLKFIEELDKELIIGVTGNCGIALTDELKKRRRFRIIEMPIDLQRKFADMIKINEHFPQIINY